MSVQRKQYKLSINMWIPMYFNEDSLILISCTQFHRSTTYTLFPLNAACFLRWTPRGTTKLIFFFLLTFLGSSFKTVHFEVQKNLSSASSSGFSKTSYGRIINTIWMNSFQYLKFSGQVFTSTSIISFKINYIYS